jgi:hypothetical protein
MVAEEEQQLGFRKNVFSEWCVNYGTWEDGGYGPYGEYGLPGRENMDFGLGPGGLDGLGGLGGFAEELGAYRNFSPGMNSLGEPPYPDNEEGDGVDPPPCSIGLKHLLCAFSNGKVNLNTAPLEVILALLQGGGEPEAWNADEKLEIGLAIVAHRNGYTEEFLQQLEEEEAGLVEYDTAEEEYLSENMGVPAAEDLPTNFFRSVADLEKIGEEDEELLETGVESVTNERSPKWLLKKDLTEVAVFNSEYFHVQVVAKGEGFKQEAEFVVHRDIKKKAVTVEYFRERQD